MDTIKELEATGNTIKECDAYRVELVRKRDTLVTLAREEGHTWRELAELLDMTQHGLIKSAKR